MICESTSIYANSEPINILYCGGYHLLQLGVNLVDFVLYLVYNTIQ